jgi:sigma-B regulation protein RsbU (phosphoserine phosphatase)
MKSDSIPDRLRPFARQQPLYLVTATGVAAIFWAITGSAPSLAVTLIYSFALGNLTAITLESIPAPAMVKARGGCLAFYSVVLLITTPFVVTASTAIVFMATVPAPHGDFWRYLAHSWKFPSVANVIFGIGYLLYKVSRDGLEKQNVELQHTITLDRDVRTSEAAELQQAREIQQNLLPKQIPQLAGFEIAGTWEPAKVVGGDYYDVIRLSENKLAICIADVAGKGISAALLMAHVQAAVRAFATDSASPSEVCRRLNSVLCTNTATDKFVTLFYGVLDSRQQILRYTNAGHLPPIVTSADGTVVRLENSGALLGVFAEWTYHDSMVQVGAGDTLLLFTDGITEASSDQGEEFGEDRLVSTMLQQRESSAKDLQSHVLQQVKQFCNFRLSDDATLVVISATHLIAERATQPLSTQKELSYSGVHND